MNSKKPLTILLAAVKSIVSKTNNSGRPDAGDVLNALVDAELISQVEIDEISKEWDNIVATIELKVKQGLDTEQAFLDCTKGSRFSGILTKLN